MFSRRLQLGTHTYRLVRVRADRKPRWQGWLAGLFGTIAAKFDAAQTTADNRRHWANADYLSPNAAVCPEVRQKLRSRSRYEVANNGYARGMITTLADYVIGTGPRLQMATGDEVSDRVIEREFARWAKARGLAEKLHTMRVAQAESGECFGILADNPNAGAGTLNPVPVTLDVRLIEADLVTAPILASPFEDRYCDGIRYDEFGNPVSYDILRRHPGEITVGMTDPLEFDTYAARDVLHLFRADRPGQSRGVPEISASLPLYANLRRYTMATVHAAENAALMGGVIHSDAPALDEDPEPVEMFDEVELERNMYTTLPAGWKLSQLKAEQPTTMYGEFKRELINEIARPLNMPFNVAAGNSSGYNYASGRLDHQAFHKAIEIDRGRVEAMVLDRIFMAWFNEAVRIEGYLPQSLRTIDVNLTHQWFWDGLEHVDPAKEANAQATRLTSHTTTLAAEYARQGLDWETELRQRARETKLMKELGLPEAKAAPVADDEKDEEEDDEVETKAAFPRRIGRREVA